MRNLYVGEGEVIVMDKKIRDELEKRVRYSADEKFVSGNSRLNISVDEKFMFPYNYLDSAREVLGNKVQNFTIYF